MRIASCPGALRGGSRGEAEGIWCPSQILFEQDPTQLNRTRLRGAGRGAVVWKRLEAAAPGFTCTSGTLPELYHWGNSSWRF